MHGIRVSCDMLELAAQDMRQQAQIVATTRNDVCDKMAAVKCTLQKSNVERIQDV
jgi:hypothetical protein